MTAVPSLIGVPSDTRPVQLARLAMFDRYRAERRVDWVSTSGPSMTPLVRPGDRLLVEFGRQPRRVGEVVLVRDGERLVAHRFVARRRVAGQSRVVTKGDAEAFPDRTSSPEDVLGVVVAIRHPDGTTDRRLLGGARAVAAAHVSWWSGRLARTGRRATRRLPPAVRPLATATVIGLTRLPMQVITAPMAWTTRNHVRKEVIQQ